MCRGLLSFCLVGAEVVFFEIVDCAKGGHGMIIVSADLGGIFAWLCCGWHGSMV